VPLKVELDTKISQITAQAIIALGDDGGLATAKKEAALALLTKAHQVGNAAATYYTVTLPDPSKKRKVDWNKSKLAGMLDTELLYHGEATWKLADPIKANLPPWGASIPDTDALKTAYEFYMTLVQAPQTEIADTAAAGAELWRKVKATKTWLKEIMDQAFSSIQFTATELYEKYFNSRAIIDLRGGNGDEFEKAGTVAQLTTANIALVSVNVSNTAEIRFVNETTISGLTLHYYFSTAPGAAIEDGVTAISVVSGSGNTVEAHTLGRNATRIYLNVKNADATHPQDWKVTI